MQTPSPLHVTFGHHLVTPPPLGGGDVIYERPHRYIILVVNQFKSTYIYVNISTHCIVLHISNVGKLQDRINFHAKIKSMYTNAKQFEI